MSTIIKCNICDNVIIIENNQVSNIDTHSIGILKMEIPYFAENKIAYYKVENVICYECLKLLCNNSTFPFLYHNKILQEFENRRFSAGEIK